MHKADSSDSEGKVHYVVSATAAYRVCRRRFYPDGGETLYYHQQALMKRLRGGSRDEQRRGARDVHPLTLFARSKKPMLESLAVHKGAKVVLHWVAHGSEYDASLYERVGVSKPLFVTPEQAVSFFVARGLPRDVPIHFKVNACFSGVRRLGGSVAQRMAQAFAVAGYSKVVVRGYLGEVSDYARHSYCKVYYPRADFRIPAKVPQLPVGFAGLYTTETTRASDMSVDFYVASFTRPPIFLPASSCRLVKEARHHETTASPWLDAVKRGMAASEAASEAEAKHP